MFIRKPVFMTEAPPETPAPGATPPQGGSTPPPEAKPEEGKTFTQADVERIIAGRLAKFADYDDLKSKLSQVEEANATEAEKAIKAAREEARKEALTEATPRLVRAEFKAAAVGRLTQDQLNEFLEDLDLSKYVTKDGEVDTDRIAKKITALAPEREAEVKTAPSFGGGPRKSEPARAGSLGEAITNKIASQPR